MFFEVPTGDMPDPSRNKQADLASRDPDVLAELDMNITLDIETDIEVAREPLSSTMDAFHRRARRAFNLDGNDRSAVSQVE